MDRYQLLNKKIKELDDKVTAIANNADKIIREGVPYYNPNHEVIGFGLGILGLSLIVCVQIYLNVKWGYYIPTTIGIMTLIGRALN